MIKEAYCSFEVAKLLKEKGFNEKCRGGYHSEFDDDDNPIVMLEEWAARPYNNDFVDEGFLCSAPTHQMAMAWVRDKYKIFIEAVFGIHKNESCFYYKIIDMSNNDLMLASYIVYNSYEEAVDSALKYTLENIIL